VCEGVEMPLALGDVGALAVWHGGRKNAWRQRMIDGPATFGEWTYGTEHAINSGGDRRVGPASLAW
jgi:hypothetical protein